MRRLITLLLTAAFLLGVIWYVGYRDTTRSILLEASDFAGLDMQAALQKVADAAIEGGAPGAVVYAYYHGETFEAAAGIANKRTGQPMPTEHPLRMASITKVYTSAIVLGLVGEGKLRLDQPISEVLPADVISKLYNGTDITVRHLLQHTSGIADYYDAQHYLFGDWTTEPLTLERTLPVSARGQPSGQAGERFNYTSMSFIVLGRVAELASGEPYDVLLERFVTRRLGHMATTYNVKHPVPDSIHGYGTKLRPWADTWDYWEHSGPDAGIMAPAHEIVEFLRALTFEGGALSDIGTAMLADQVESWSPMHRQALGIQVRLPSDGTRHYGHSGDVFGYETVAFAIPDRDYIFVGQVNCDCERLSGGTLRNNFLQAEEGVSGR